MSQASILCLPVKSRSQIDLLEEIIKLIFEQLEEPYFIQHSDTEAGFRFLEPSPFHFCMLKLTRCISTLNAMACLYEKGYNQEICTLARIIVECCTHSDFVASAIKDGSVDDKTFEFLSAFFLDYRRARGITPPGKTVRQEKVHKQIGFEYDALKSDAEYETHLHAFLSRENLDPELALTPAANLMSEIYRSYSNYVHAKYPEIMDMFGGTSAKPHMSGMPNTPKDEESLDHIDSIIIKVSNTLKYVILKFEAQVFLSKSPKLQTWFNTRL